MRRFKFYGTTFGDFKYVNISAVFNHRVVFDGKVDVVGPLADLTSNIKYSEIRVELFECELEYEVTGLVPLTITVSNGILMFGNIEANYTLYPGTDSRGYANPKYVFTQLFMDRDFKRNVQIGQEKIPISHEMTAGEWYYQIDNTTFQCDIELDPARRTMLPSVLSKDTRIGNPDPLYLPPTNPC